MNRIPRIMICLLALTVGAENVQAGRKEKAAGWWRRLASALTNTCTVSGREEKASGGFLARFVEGFRPSGFESPDMDLLDQQRGAPDFQPVVKRIQGLQAAAINVFQSSGREETVAFRLMVFWQDLIAGFLTACQDH